MATHSERIEVVGGPLGGGTYPYVRGQRETVTPLGAHYVTAQDDTGALYWLYVGSVSNAA